MAQPTKQGWLYVFDRLTGAPIWPMPETPVPQTNMPTEKTSPTQPIPSNPPPYSATYVKTTDIIDFTPALHQQALDNLKKFRWEQSIYVPPLGPNDPRLGSINIGNAGGGVNWPGSGFDPETATFYTQANNSGVTVGKYEEEEFEQVRADKQVSNGKSIRKPRWEADPDYGRYGTNQPGAAPPVRPAPTGGIPGNTGRQALTQGLDGLPITKPPYGVVVGIDLNAGGKIIFSVPHGETPDSVRNHPLLQGHEHPADGPGRQRRGDGYQDDGRIGRGADHLAARTRARRDAARLRQEGRPRDRRCPDAGGDQLVLR